jgi:hypothetical protein
MAGLVLALAAIVALFWRKPLARRIAWDSIRHPFTRREIDRENGTLP